MNNRKQQNESDKPSKNDIARGKRVLLRLIWASQPISRAELARRMDFNRSSVTEIVKPLLKKKILKEKPLDYTKDSKGFGRPPIGLSLNNKKDYFIGVNLGVKHSQIGYTTLKWKMKDFKEFETPKEPFEALNLIAEKIEELCSSVKTRKLRTVGITVPGATNIKRSELIYAPHLGWENIKVVDYLNEKLGFDKSDVSIVLENNAAASAMYEVRLLLPEDRKMRDYTVIRSGTGIGVGLVFDGEVYRGMSEIHGNSGEFGHMTILAGGKLCVCGNYGCWEQYASAPAATSLYSETLSDKNNNIPIRFAELAQKAKSGERKAQRALEKIGEYLGIGIANIIMGFGVPNIIVSGRLVYGWKYLREPLREAINRSMAGKIGSWSVKSGEPSGASLGGALEIAVEEYFNNL